MTRTIGSTLLKLVQGDLTTAGTDAIVNAANSTLMGGGGVDGAIHRRGGPAILEACRQIRRDVYPDGLPTSQAVLTAGGELPARYVIHTVGPIWQGGTANEAGLLAAAYRNSLAVAVAHGLRSVAFPSISTGAYGYPVHEAAPTALASVAAFVTEQEEGVLDEVHFYLLLPRDLKAYERVLGSVLVP